MVTIELTQQEAQWLDRVFLPANPNKLRSATPEVRALALKVKQQIAAQVK